MTLTWYGHACFKLEAEGGSVVFDPYTPGRVPGLTLPPLTADLVICSHGHGDHNYADGVTLSGETPKLAIRQIPCFHDPEQGRLRGGNLITAVEAEGVRLAHMGDIGHMLSPEQLATLGPVDVLLIPVGGFFTVDAAGAKALCEAIEPRVIVPMHYRRGEQGLQQIAELAPFLSLFPAESVTQLDSASVRLSLPAQQEILVFPWPENSAAEAE